MIRTRFLIIFHAITWQELVVRPVTIQIDFPLLARCLEREVYPRIVGSIVYLLVITITDEERTLRRLIMNITHARFIRKDEGVEMIAIPLQFLQSHRRMVHVEHLKLAIHVTCREDQVSLMRPLKALGTHIVRLHVPDRIVPSAILQHDGLQLAHRVGDAQVAVLQGALHLLMTFVDIDVGIRGIAEGYVHLQLHHHKASRKHRLAVVILVKDRQLIVAAHGDATI